VIVIGQLSVISYLLLKGNTASAGVGFVGIIGALNSWQKISRTESARIL
jgi:uncharacterized membrane protein